MRKRLFPIKAFSQAFLISFEHRFFHLGLQALHEKAFQFFLRGKLLATLESEVEQFLADEFYQFFYFPALSRLRRAQHEGHYTLILSSSPSFIVGPIANYLGVALWRASEYMVGEDGRFKEVGSVLSGEEKGRYLIAFAKAHHIAEKDVIAYSDSPLDLPFLMAAGKAVVANPSRSMKRICRKKNWEII